jgi:ubiquitin-conjugating enzyme E2 S
MSNGSICVNTLKRDWVESTTLSHVLSVIRCLLIIPFPESSLNDEAGKFFMESYDEYARRARLMADVHGRPKPCTSYLSELKKNDIDNITPTSSADPLSLKKCPPAMNNSNTPCSADGAENRMDGGNVDENSDANKKAKKDMKKAAVDKTKKKKNLKRL